MAITNLDQLINGFTIPYNIYKSAGTAEGAGTYHGTWRSSGYPGIAPPPVGFTVGSGYTYDNTSIGAIPLPSYTGNIYLAKIAVNLSVVGSVILYDKLWQASGFLCNTTGVQTVTTPGSLPPRDINNTSSGVGCELWGEFYGAPGATAGTWYVTYTNSNGLANRTGYYVHPANAETSGQMIPFVLQGGDNGIQSIQSAKLSNTTTAGNLALLIMRRITDLPCTQATLGFYKDAVSLGLPIIHPSSCLTLMHGCSSTTFGSILGSLTFATG